VERLSSLVGKPAILLRVPLGCGVERRSSSHDLYCTCIIR
jgi:hypothetical protein